MPVTFNQINVGDTYSRHDLAQMWGYAGVEAISRGVVTPRDDAKIVLFVTQDKHPTATPYDDQLAESVLLWEGPNDHFGEDRIVAHRNSQEEVHLFHRQSPTDDFTYSGQLALWCFERRTNGPSRFAFRLQHAPSDQPV